MVGDRPDLTGDATEEKGVLPLKFKSDHKNDRILIKTCGHVRIDANEKVPKNENVGAAFGVCSLNLWSMVVLEASERTE